MVLAGSSGEIGSADIAEGLGQRIAFHIPGSAAKNQAAGYDRLGKRDSGQRQHVLRQHVRRLRRQKAISASAAEFVAVAPANPGGEAVGNAGLVVAQDVDTERAVLDDRGRRSALVVDAD